MATSTQVVNGKARVFNDLDLMALVCLMEEELDSNHGAYGALRPVVLRWQRELEIYGPGTIDLDLDQFAVLSEAREELENLLVGVQHALNGFGQAVPASLLAKRCRASGVEFSDYPTALVAAAAAALADLLVAAGAISGTGQ